MTLHLFATSGLSSQPVQDVFNRFCLTHRVVSIESQSVADENYVYRARCTTLAAEHSIPFDSGSSRLINRKALGVRVGGFADAT